jgi:hypothetical protein
MGNSSNTPNKGKPFPHGSVEILADHNLYYAGEVITGTVRLTLTQPFPNTSFIIQIKGVEKAQIFVTPEQRGFSSAQKKEFKDKHVIMTNQLVITSPDANHFPPGNYSYPFSFQLNAQLPDSFIHDVSSSENSAKAKVGYKLKAGLFDSISTYYLIKSIPFYVTSFRQPYDSKNTVSLKVKQSGISSLIFSSYVTLSMNVMDPRVAAGEDFQVEIGVDAKEAKHSVPGVVLEVLQQTTIHINGNKVQTNNTLWRKDIQQKVEKGSTVASPNGIRLIVPSTVTANLMNACSTKNINNAYFLKLSLPIESNIVSGLFDKATDVVLPIHVYRKRAQIPQRIIMPHDQVSQMSQYPVPPPMPSQFGNQMYPGYPPQYQAPIPGQPYPPNPGFGQQPVYPPNPGFGQAPVYPPNPGFGQAPPMPPNSGFDQVPVLLPNPGFGQPHSDEKKPETEANEFRVSYPSLDDENFKNL